MVGYAFGSLVLLVALFISSTAAYYSIVGLTAIFSAAILPIIIMAGALEVGKIVATVWLHVYWRRAGFISKTYLIMAVFVLMVITSVGIFGFLSNAHSEQSFATDTNQVQIENIDTRIAAENQRVASADVVLAQLDETVQTLINFDRIRGADGAIAVRESQRDERATLQAQIDRSRDTIVELEETKFELNQARVGLEAEVGPLKYIAAVIYGDAADADLLENAVRWVIILLVVVFDPLAIMLVLAGVMTLEWAAADRRQRKTDTEIEVDNTASHSVEYIDNPIYIHKTLVQYVDVPQIEIVERVVEHERVVEREIFVPVDNAVDRWIAVDNGAAQQDLDYAERQVRQLQQRVNELEHAAISDNTHLVQADNEKDELKRQINAATTQLESLHAEHSAAIEQARNYEEQLDTAVEQLGALMPDHDAAIAAANVIEKLEKIVDIDELLSYNSNPIKHVSELKDTIDVQQGQIKQLYTELDQQRSAGKNTILRTELERATAEYEATVKRLTTELDSAVTQRSALNTEVELLKHRITELTTTLDSAVHHDTVPEDASFGLKFPVTPIAGDVFLRIDYKPARLYKYTGTRWLPIDRTSTDSYITDQYVEYLIKNLDSRHLADEDLTENEEFYVNKLRKTS